MLPKKRSIAMLLLASLTAACTPERPRTAAPELPCLAFKAISYAQLPAGVTDDPGNLADSDPTVAEIDVHNARYDALCPRK